MSIRLNGSTSGYVELDVPAVAGNQLFTLPSAAPSTAGTSLVSDTSGNLSYSTALAVSSVNGGPISGARNRIINGGMQVAQRAAPTITASPQYGKADRFIAYISGGTGISGTIDQSADTNFQSQYRMWLAGVSYTSGTWAIQQRIEALNSCDLNGKTVTVSFKIYHDFGTARSVVVSLAKANALDNFSSVTAVGLAYTSPSLPSGSYSVVTCSFSIGAADATNGLLLQINDASATSVSAKNVLIGDVQLEPGTVATPFERRSHGQELALCQRYYYDRPIFVLRSAGYSVNSRVTGHTLTHPTTMRAAPTITTANIGYSNTNTLASESVGTTGLSFTYGQAADANCYVQFSYTASIEL